MTTTTVTAERNRVTIDTEHYTIDVRRNQEWVGTREGKKKTRIDVSGTSPAYPHPAYTLRGEDPEIDKAWDAYNREEVRLMKAAALEAFAEAGLNLPGKMAFSKKAGCGCGCSPAFIYEDQVRWIFEGGTIDQPERVSYLFITKKA